ncbi:MAG: saccharopine dehydrogenase NADP-binding domain-containing protein [Alphaproteobacteria bacterium]|nr:saccharopine dehydrogenase NADP-binding domain-containing protein [Alphaproteobacteria bacterium]
MSWMIYGANGYTGQLCAEEAVARGMAPVLAGRNGPALAALGARLGLPHVTFDLSDVTATARHLEGVAVVLHCAGPFSATSGPMLDACLRTGTAYLDITGELGVFEAVFARGAALAEAGVVAVPGVGFDVVPTDTMAARLGDALPDATALHLAFAGLGGGVSQGTAKTAVEGLPHGGAARIGGRIQAVPPAWRTREVPLGDKERFVVSIPWGDVSTAFHTTGIPDITCYAAFPRSSVRWMKAGAVVGPLLALGPVQRLLKRVVEATIAGPDADQRARGISHVWGRAEAADGRWVESTLSTPEGYRFTALSSVEAVARVLGGDVAPGAHTPSRAFGVDFLAGIDGVTLDPIRSGP